VGGCGDVEGGGLSAFLTKLSRDDWTMAFFLAVFIRTPEYFVFPYVKKNFPHLENSIVCLMEQFA
jgi:hypothetical protein